MYVNIKMIPVKTIPGMGEEGIKESSGGVNSSMTYLIHYKNFCECHNVLPLSTTIKNKKKKSFNLIKCYRAFKVKMKELLNLSKDVKS
jgi:hypothetical protein